MDSSSHTIDNRNVTPIGIDLMSTPGLNNQKDNYVLDLRNSVVSLNNAVVNTPQSNFNKSRIKLTMASTLISIRFN